jgi:tRNA nucleotidyltransferase (CCA-adding enzyme)
LKIIEHNSLEHTIIKKIIAHNGRPYIVGGAVRDFVMHLPIKDIDIEIHGLSEHELETILQEFGTVSLVGKSFGVLRLHSINVDWSLPRTDSAGRKPIVIIDSNMSIKDALRRRDLTMNAMAIDLINDQLIDPFDGQSDIKNKILRTPDARLFVEDPLRFYRVMQFISRFEMFPNDELDALCFATDIQTVSRERIEQEFKKLLLLSKKPSLGIRWMQKINRLHDILPELFATVSTKQNPHWHPEGSVFEHSMQALDAAAVIVKKYDNEQHKLIVLYAALCHDLGKVTTTQYHNGVLKSFGHEKETACVRSMLRRITHDSELISAVISLVHCHMIPLQLVAQHSKVAAYKRLALKLKNNVPMQLLVDLVDADRRGRNGDSHEPLPGPCADVTAFVEKVKQAGVFEQREAAIVTGADLLHYIQAGPRMGQLLRRAYEIQINEGIVDKEVLLKRILDKNK